MRMTLWNLNRPATRLWGLLTVVLGLCVFAWGLQYKLSLYDAPQAPTFKVPMASLLSRNEWRPAPGLADTQAPHATQAAPSMFGPGANVALLVAALLLAPPATARIEHRNDLVPPIRLPFHNSSFVRPPPFLG